MHIQPTATLLTFKMRRNELWEKLLYLVTVDLVFLNLPLVTRIVSSITVSSGDGGPFAGDFSALEGTFMICLASALFVTDWLELSGP